MKLKLILIAITAIAVQTGHSQNTWTLDTCINYALKNNLNILKQDLTVSVLRNNYDITRFNALPSVNANLNGGVTFGQSFSQDKGGFINEVTTGISGEVSANVTLFNGLKNFHSIRRTEKELEAAMANNEAFANDIALLIVNYYLQILYNQEQKNVAKTQLATTKSQIERTEQLFNAGSVPKGDLLELKAQAANERSQIISYTNLEREARLNLKQTMNVQVDTLIIASPQNIDAEKLYASIQNIDSIYSIAIQHLPEVKAAKAKIESSLHSIDVAKADYYPSLYLGGSVSTRYNDAAVLPQSDNYSFGDQIKDFRNAYIGMTLSIPIFNKFHTKLRVTNSEIDYEISKQDELLTLQDIYKRIEAAGNDAHAAFVSYKASKESLTANQEAFAYAEERFNSGVINSVDYNMVKANLTKAQVNMVNARYELIFKVKILDFYMGKDFEI